MGMDLIPQHKGKKYPENVDLHYNWYGWSELVRFLQAYGVDTCEFDGANDGNRICAATCKEVATVLEKHAVKHFGKLDGEYFKSHADAWRYSGGVRQY